LWQKSIYGWSISVAIPERIVACLFSVAGFGASVIDPGAAFAHTATGQRWMIATGNALATEAAAEVFRDGGNAVDAAVAAALTLGVVDGNNSGIGGGCLILIRSSDGKFTAIDGRETAPAAAHKNMFVSDGKPLPNASQTGPLAVGTPGALAAYQLAIDRCGTKTLADLLEPGIKLANEGFVINASLAGAIRGEANDLRKFAGSRAVLLHADGSPVVEGERLVQPDLANTYRQVAEHGIDWFYRGPFAKQVGEWMAANGGILTAADFAEYEAKLREPLRTTYRGYEIVGFPPPSSGGIHVAQILNILENFDLRANYQQDPAQAAHIVTEAFKLAFADRAHWLGDADFVDVPRGLISKEYAKELADRIDVARAIDVPSHGNPPNWRQDFFGRHTTHVAAADADGNWVALTATVNTGFGSKVIVPGTGVVLNNEMDDFSIYPGVPNAFGLIGAENNSVEPGKRPLSSMSPTIVLDSNGQSILTLGAAGGPKIITQVVLTIVRYLDFGQPLPDAVAGPRFHHQWRPNRVASDTGLAQGLQDGLQARGHELETLGSAGRTQAIAAENGKLIGVSDPRGQGNAIGE
jgi:gamma-glutamyltranspeptidase/glutathione hydrolase